MFAQPQFKWKDFVSDANLLPKALDVERTSVVDFGIGQLPVPAPFAGFRKGAQVPACPQPACLPPAGLLTPSLPACLPAWLPA